MGEKVEFATHIVFMQKCIFTHNIKIGIAFWMLSRWGQVSLAKFVPDRLVVVGDLSPILY